MARVLRIPCQNNDTPFVLVHVNGPAAGSSRPLDATLVGTEGIAPYILTLKQNKVSSLKSKNGPCTQDEWLLILESVLLGIQASDNHGNLLQSIETVASVKENTSIDITIRKRIEGITQRLGAFSLSYDENQEIQLFEWCSIAVQSASDSANELASFRSKFQEQQAMISRLNAQLEALIIAKTNHEAELMEKFRDLLNDKKAKIRDQQRLLAAAKIDTKKLTPIQATDDSSTKTSTSHSKTRKRKAGSEPYIGEASNVEEHGIEKMDIDVDQPPSDSDQQNIETPDGDETQTVDEDEDDDDDIQETNLPVVTTGNAANAESSRKDRERDQDREGDPLKTPPRRELPFTKRKETEVTLPVQGGDETASEDDEL